MSQPIRVTIWNEFKHEKIHPEVQKVYPDGMHQVIAEGLKKYPGFEIGTATLDEPEHGLTDDVLEKTDVMLWWGHMAHHEVKDEIVAKVHEKVLGGMGLIVLHSGHFSKIFQKLLGTTCNLKWREAGEKERLWVVDPAHPIARGIGQYIELPQTEMYGEQFDIPQPDELVFISWFQGGEVFRSGCCFHRSRGKIFYFRPGHETYPIYFNEEIIKVIKNGIEWAAPSGGPEPGFGNPEPLEKL